MFRNYLKTAFRSLLKNKAYSFLNIFGLAIGIGGLLVLLWPRITAGTHLGHLELIGAGILAGASFFWALGSVFSHRFNLTPVAIVRKLSGKDSLNLRGFRASRQSAMIQRDHLFTGKDLEKPY